MNNKDMPQEMSSLRGFGFTLDILSGRTRQWFYRDGQKKWADTGDLVECLASEVRSNLDEAALAELEKRNGR